MSFLIVVKRTGDNEMQLQVEAMDEMGFLMDESGEMPVQLRQEFQLPFG